MTEQALIAFLRARYDEDEQTARAAGNRRWLVQDNIIELYPEREDDGFMSWPTRADARHAANWEPARVLREVDAKRQIVELREAWAAAANPAPSANLAVRFADQVHAADMILRLLALSYADHPDYREEWKP